MVFNKFAWFTGVRIILLTLTLLGICVCLSAQGYYGITAILIAFSLGQVYSLFKSVNKINSELTHFLEAARNQDFGQKFLSGTNGVGFEQLSSALSEILQKVRNDYSEQEKQLLHFKSLTEHIPIPLISINSNNTIQLHNNAARRLFGNISVNKLEDLKVFGEGFFDALSQQQRGKRQLVPFIFDGVERQVSIAMTQVVTGDKSELLVSMHDIQSELDTAQLQAWEDLVRVLTHEIMNSITPVSSLAKTAKEMIHDVQEQLNDTHSVQAVIDEIEDVHTAIETVANRSESLMQFVQSYRSLSLVPKPQKQLLSVSELITKVHALLTANWKKQNIHFSISIEPEDLQVSADPDLLEQLLINVLTNAEQALIDHESPKVTLYAHLNKRGSVLIEISDNGPGIPDDIIQKVFIPFFTTKRSGSGVGLALTRQIMIAHGGSVQIHNPKGGGAQCNLTFN